MNYLFRKRIGLLWLGILLIATCLGASTGGLRTAVRAENLDSRFRPNWEACRVSVKLFTEADFLSLVDGNVDKTDDRVFLVGILDFPNRSVHRVRTNFHIQLELDGVALHPFVVSIPPEPGPHRIPFATELHFFIPPNLNAKRRGISALIPGKQLVLIVSKIAPEGGMNQTIQKYQSPSESTAEDPGDDGPAAQFW